MRGMPSNPAVIPAKAGTRGITGTDIRLIAYLGSRLRGNDESGAG